MPTNESALVTAIVKAIVVTYPGAWVFKVVGSPYQMAGVPDLLACVQGRLVGLEVKHARPGESKAHALSRTTPQQEVQIMRINRAGGVAGTVVSVTDALGLVERALSQGRDKSGAQHH